MKNIRLLSAGLLLTISTVLSAQVPRTISFQGVLTDPGTGTNVADGNYDFNFSIYNTSTGGTQLWTESHPGVAVNDGLYHVILGSSTPLNATNGVSFDAPYWLEVKVASSGNPLEILAGRIELTSSAYILNASLMDLAQDLSDGELANSKLDADLQDLADGTLSGSKVGIGIQAANITFGTIANARLDVDLQDLADGTLTGSKVGTGIQAGNITVGTIANARLDVDLQDLADGTLTDSKLEATVDRTAFNATGDITAGNDIIAGNDITATGNFVTAGGGLIGGGNSAIGGPVDNSARLQLRGATDNDLEYGLKVQNSSGTDLFTIRNDGNVGSGVISQANQRFTIRGATDDNTAFGLNVQNFSGTDLFVVRNDGMVSTSGNFIANNNSAIGGNTDPLVRLKLYGSTDDGSAYALTAQNFSASTLFSVRNDGFTSIGGNLSVSDVASIGVLPQANQKLTIQGSTSDNTAHGLVVENSSGNTLLRVRNDGEVNINGKVTHPSTGPANLLPIAMGNISAAGFVNGGTGNFTVTHTGSGTYEISITGFSFNSSDFGAVITIYGISTERYVSYWSSSGNLIVNISDPSGTAVNNPFNFLVYQY